MIRVGDTEEDTLGFGKDPGSRLEIVRKKNGEKCAYGWNMYAEPHLLVSWGETAKIWKVGGFRTRRGKQP